MAAQVLRRIQEDLMIQYADFSFAGPPRTGRRWFVAAAEKVGLKILEPVHCVDKLPPADHQGISVSIVRHPFDWLVSLYQNQPTFRYYDNTVLNQIIHLASVSQSFPHFIKSVQDWPGTVGRIFDAYRATTILRLEDFPWSPIEFFQSLDCPEDKVMWLKNFQPQSASAEHKVPQDRQVELKRAIVKSERRFCESYDFF